MCTYYSKGTADYVGVWDFDEFFQPMGTNKNILDVLDAMEPEDGPIKYFYSPDAVAATILPKEFIPRRGMADKDGHPFCYLILKSEVTLFERERGEDIQQVISFFPVCYDCLLIKLTTAMIESVNRSATDMVL